MKTSLFCLDIETCSQSADELITRFNPQFEADSIPEPKPDTRLKDPVKIAANLALVEEKKASREADIAASIQAKRQKWLDDSALYPERGKVLAIGWSGHQIDFHAVHGEDEALVLYDFIHALRLAIQQGLLVSGFNILGFDLPFIRKRCLINRIPFPYYQPLEKWKQWTFPVYDAMKDWQCGDYKAPFVSLDTVARSLGVGRKTGDGADFAKLYATDPDAALRYLENDVKLARDVCDRMLGEGGK